MSNISLGILTSYSPPRSPLNWNNTYYISSWLLTLWKEKTASFATSASSSKLYTWEEICRRTDTCTLTFKTMTVPAYEQAFCQKCSCFEVRKVHIIATLMLICCFHLLAFIYFLKKIWSQLHWWNKNWVIIKS